MKCSFCGGDFLESDIQESHDVPCYLFFMDIGRPAKKQKADKLGRRYLCLDCHERYEEELHVQLIKRAKEFAKGYFHK